jgi:hypothetical protein
VKYSRQQTSKKALVAALGVIAAAGIAGVAFAASISGNGINAGQGVTVTSGYSAGAVTYSGGWTNTATNNSSDLITQVQFVLRTTENGTGSSTVSSGNANVWVQVATASNYGNWASCLIGGGGTVTCTLTGSQRIAMSTATGVNIVAVSK